MTSIESSLLANPVKEKSPNALRTISEASDLLEVPQHVLRFWETKFHHIKPLKRNGGRRFYRPQDLEILGRIKHLLYSQGYTIKGAKKAIDDFAHSRGDWLNTLPNANVNDNIPVCAEETASMALAEIAEALSEPEVMDARTVEVTAAEVPSNLVALAALRMELAHTRDRLAETLQQAA